MQITIATHNAFWFQGYPSRWGRERQQGHPDVLQALIRLYEKMSPDVLGLQEVPGEDLVVELEKQLGMRGNYAPGGIIAAYGGAVMVRSLEASLDDGSTSAAPSRSSFERSCISTRTKVGNSFLKLVSVHLSGNRLKYLDQIDPVHLACERYPPGLQGEPVRLAEVAALLDVIPRPDVIVGDFNSTPGSAVYREMTDHGYVDAAAFNDDRLTSACCPLSVKENRVDYIWLAEHLRGCQVDYRRINGKEFCCEDADPPTRLSDHLPVVVRLDL